MAEQDRYVLEAHERVDFDYWFHPPFPWSAVRQGEIMRYWCTLAEEPHRIILQHGSGVIAIMRRVGDEVTETRLYEREEAEPWLRSHGFPVREQIRSAVAALLTPGRALETILDAKTLIRLSMSEIHPNPDPSRPARRFHLSWGGVLEVDLAANATVLRHRWHTGGAALDLLDAWSVAKRWKVPPYSPEALVARTREHAALFVQVQKGVAREERGEGSFYGVLAATPEGHRRFAFTLTEPYSPGLGMGHSTLFDPVELVLFAARVERELPKNLAETIPMRRAQLAASLRAAASGLREATRLIPPGEELPPVDIHRSAIAGRFREKNPERFTRAHLESEAQRLETLAGTYDPG